jgi:hypothetical protein
MKLSAGFNLRAEAELKQVRSAGKDALRQFKTPTMAFPVSEGMSDAPTSTDLAPPGRLAAAKDKDGFGLLKMKNILLFQNTLVADKARVTENRDLVKEQKTPDATMPLDEKSIGTITFDTSKGSTVVAELEPGDPNRKFEVWWESNDKVTYAPVAFATKDEAEAWAKKKNLAGRHNDWGIRDREAENAGRREKREARKARDAKEVEKAKAVLDRHKVVSYDEHIEEQIKRFQPGDAAYLTSDGSKPTPVTILDYSVRKSSNLQPYVVLHYENHPAGSRSTGNIHGTAPIEQFSPAPELEKMVDRATSYKNRNK